jgi:hypothetical protein
MKSMAEIISNTNRIADASAWVRCLTTRSSHKKGRRLGSKIRFHGLYAFAAEHGVTPQHAHYVLAGKRESRRLIEAWEKRAV